MLEQPILDLVRPLVTWLPLGGVALATFRIGSLFLLADGNPTDILAGSSGWAGVGILGAVLSWLMMIHLPAKDKQQMEMFKEMRGMAKDIQDHCDKEIERILTLKIGPGANGERKGAA